VKSRKALKTRKQRGGDLQKYLPKALKSNSRVKYEKVKERAETFLEKTKNENVKLLNINEANAIKRELLDLIESRQLEESQWQKLSAYVSNIDLLLKDQDEELRNAMRKLQAQKRGERVAATKQQIEEEKLVEDITSRMANVLTAAHVASLGTKKTSSAVESAMEDLRKKIKELEKLNPQHLNLPYLKSL
jgi:hypothetical protein